MKAIELAIYTPEGKIKVDTGVYKTDIDKRLSLGKLVEQAKNKVIGIGVCADYGSIRYKGHFCQVAGFRIVDIKGRPGSVFVRRLEILTDFIPVETRSVARLKERFARGDFPDYKFSDALAAKI